MLTQRALLESRVYNPLKPGESPVFNQFTEQFNVLEMAKLVQAAARKRGMNVDIIHTEPPRVEQEVHYYNAKHTKLVDLGLKPHKLSDVLIDSVFERLAPYRDRVRLETIMPFVNWRSTGNPCGYLPGAMPQARQQAPVIEAAPVRERRAKRA